MKVNIVVSPDHTYIVRNQYTFLAWIGDVGALFDALQQIAGIFFVALFKIKVLLDNDLISAIFRKREPKSMRMVKVKLSYTDWLCENFKQYCLRCWCFRKKRRSRLIRDVGNRRIERNLDVAYFIRQQLLFKAMYKIQTTKLQRQLNRRHHSLVVDDSDELGTTSSSATDSNIDELIREQQRQPEQKSITIKNFLENLRKKKRAVKDELSKDKPPTPQIVEDRTIQNDISLITIRDQSPSPILPQNQPQKKKSEKISKVSKSKRFNSPDVAPVFKNEKILRRKSLVNDDKV